MKKSFFPLFAIMLMIAFVACKGTSGEKAEVTSEGDVSSQSGDAYTVNTDASTINWEASKVTGTHTGTLSIDNGTVYVENNQVTAGEFTLDMNSINVTDLEGEWKDKLEAHLKGTNDKQADDFFNVTKYPTATFKITKVTDLSGDPAANSMVYGNLKMKDITKQVGFKANIQVTNEGVSVTTQPFKINRTDWNINFRSPSLFENLQDKAIDDEFSLSINLNAPAPMS